jgi:tight adherence protein C
MNRLKIYELVLLLPALLFSIRIILNELSKSISISDYSNKQIAIQKLISTVTRTKINQNALNEELTRILQMCSIMISAGESPMSALRYISQRSIGTLSSLINNELKNLEADGNLIKTFEYLAVTSGSKQVRRLGNSLQVAINRGSPLLQVIQNQVLSINKEIHTNLLRRSGQKEIALLIPVVFLILPISILFAVWPSIYSLNLSTF